MPADQLDALKHVAEACFNAGYWNLIDLKFISLPF